MREVGIKVDCSRRVADLPIVWFEVEDFLRYFDHFQRPTGTQRVPLEIFSEAERHYSHTGRVRFCRLSAYTNRFQLVDFNFIMSTYLNPPGIDSPLGKTRPDRSQGTLREISRTIGRLPRYASRVTRTAVRDFLEARRQQRRFEQLMTPGDIVVSLGASWGIPGYGRHIAAAKKKYGFKFSILIHDIIPLANDAFVDQRHAARFGNWLHEMISNADMVLTVSKYSRDDLLRLSAPARWSLPPIEVLEMGAGFTSWQTIGRNDIRLPERFVLFVSTIEIRKNHRLLVRLWRRLLEQHDAADVPELVFAGRVGWLIDDLLADLAATNYLGGKVVMLNDLSDVELRETIQSCLFTVFPSLCEGWGLPVAESLVHGKFCVASNRTSLPEVAGDLIDYFDPTNEDDALEKIRRVLFDPDYLAAREERLRTEYRPPSWANCTHKLIGTLEQLTRAPEAMTILESTG